MPALKLSGRYYRHYPPEAYLGHAMDDLDLDLKDTAFLLVDVYGKGYDEDENKGDVPGIYSAAVEKNRSIVNKTAVHHFKTVPQVILAPKIPMHRDITSPCSPHSMPRPALPI